MDFNKIRFSNYIPTYDKYFDNYLKDKSITKYVHFSKWDSTLIFYEQEFIGFYKVITRNEEINDREIYIAIIEKYRKKGIASYIN